MKGGERGEGGGGDQHKVITLRGKGYHRLGERFSRKSVGERKEGKAWEKSGARTGAENSGREGREGGGLQAEGKAPEPERISPIRGEHHEKSKHPAGENGKEGMRKTQHRVREKVSK